MKLKVGQIWADNDKRCSGRTVRIDELELPEATGARAVCTVLTGVGGQRVASPRKVRILVSRFRPTSTGYRLLKDVK